MVVDAHPYIVNTFAVCTAVAEAVGHDTALREPLASLLAEEGSPTWSPLPADSAFLALYNGELRLHQGERAPGCSAYRCVLEHHLFSILM